MLAGALLYGCTQVQPDPTPEPAPEPAPKPEPEPAVSRTLTFVLPDASQEILKDKWVAGDQIVVHGEYAKEQVTVTLSAGDIRSDGKAATLTVDGLHPYKSTERTSTLYASYPASAVSNLPHCFCYSRFNGENTQMLAACNEGDTFNFVNLSGAICFKVSGDFDTYKFSSRKGATLSYETYQVMLTDNVTNLKQYVESPRTFFSAEVNADGERLNVIYLPGGTDLPQGYTLQMFKGEEAVKTMSVKDPVTLSQDQVLDLGDVTALLTDPVDTDKAVALDETGTANCYVVPSAGTYKFAPTRGNTEELIQGIEKVEAVWETWNTLDEVTVGSVVASMGYDANEEVIYFSTPETFRPGNALIAAKDKDGNILWSWHLWMPRTPIVTDSYANMFGTDAMSRNLGALTDTEASASPLVDAESFGMLYQWGRKDPFPGIGIPETGDNKHAALTHPMEERSEEKITIAHSILHPTQYAFNYATSTKEGGYKGLSWCSEDTSNAWDYKASEEDTEGVKGMYDPCPPGYRVPVYNSSLSGWKAGAAWSLNLANFWYKNGDAVFPYAGYRDDCGGTWCHATDRSAVWSATSYDDDSARSFDVRTSYEPKTQYKARGNSVRCVREK